MKLFIFFILAVKGSLQGERDRIPSRCSVQKCILKLDLFKSSGYLPKSPCVEEFGLQCSSTVAQEQHSPGEQKVKGPHLI